jgi:hypothetical protein
VRANAAQSAEPAGASGLKADAAMSVEQCARLVVDGMNRRRRSGDDTEGEGRALPETDCVGLVERMALAVLKDEVKPQ